MDSRKIDGTELFFDREDRETADLLERACRKSLPIIKETWGLEPPPRSRLYVMTSWWRFLWHSAPLLYRLLIVLLLPFIARSWRRGWRFLGGVTLQFQGRPAAGVKTAELMDQADRTVGRRLFHPEKNIAEKVQRTTCHELTHLFSAHLKLPLWLNEGLATIADERFAGCETVRRDTLALLDRPPKQKRPASYARLSTMKHREKAYRYARSYWLCRYLEEKHPSLIRDLLSKKRKKKRLEEAVAAAFGERPRDFWESIDSRVYAHFRDRFGKEAVAVPQDEIVEEEEKRVEKPDSVPAYVDRIGWLIIPLIFWAVVMVRHSHGHIITKTLAAAALLPVPITLLWVLRIVWKEKRYHFTVCRPVAEVDGKKFDLVRALKSSVPKSASVCASVLFLFSIARLIVHVFEGILFHADWALWGFFGEFWIQETFDIPVVLIWYGLWAIVAHDLASRKVTHADSRVALVVAIAINIALLALLPPGSTEMG